MFSASCTVCKVGQNRRISSIIVRRDALLHIGGFDEALSFAEDTDLWLQLASQYEFFFANDILTDVVNNPNSVTRRPTGAETIMENLLQHISIFEKWCPPNVIRGPHLGKTAGNVDWRIIVQEFRKKIVVFAVRRKYGWQWMLRLRAKMLTRSPIMGRQIWPSHTIFAGFIVLAALAYPVRLLARKMQTKLAITSIRMPKE